MPDSLIRERASLRPVPAPLPAAAAPAGPRLAAVALLALAAWVSSACGQTSEADEAQEAQAEPVAIVGEDTVSVGEAATYMRATRAERTLEGLGRAIDDLIAMELVQVVADRQELTPEQAKLREEWQDQLLSYQFRDSVIFKGVAASDSAVAAYYKDRVGEELKARHVLVAVPATATADEKRAARQRIEEALAKARSGEDFEELSREYSEPGTAATGGDLGWFGRGAMVPAFERAAFELQPGEISDVVETRFGFHVVKLEDRRKKALDELRPQIQSELSQPLKQEAERRYIDDMMTRSGLEFYEANIDTLVAIFRADSVGELPPQRAELPIATWRGGSLTAGDVVEKYRGLPEQNQAAVRALDADKMLNALAPFVRNEMLISRARASDVELDEERREKLEERVRSMKIGDMLKSRVKEQVVLGDSAVRAAFEADSGRYGGDFAAAEAQVRQDLLEQRLQRANTWEGQRDMIHEIAKAADEVEVRRVEENYDLVLEALEPPPSAAAGSGRAGAGDTSAARSTSDTAARTAAPPAAAVAAPAAEDTADDAGER